jgi:hypothetical protein
VQKRGAKGGAKGAKGGARGAKRGEGDGSNCRYFEGDKITVRVVDINSMEEKIGYINLRSQAALPPVILC